MQTRSKWLLPVVVMALAVAGVVLLWWQSDVSVMDRWWQAHGAVTLRFIIPPLAALLAWALKQMISSRPERSTPEQLLAAEQALAGRGLEWWRGVPEPAWPGHLLRAGLRPLDVTWAKPLTHDKPPEGGHNDRAGDGHIHGRSGDVAGLLALFRKTHPCRLVISGSAGSGKSVLARMLMAGLLKDAQPGDPVPVFLPLWSWSPRHERLHEWMKRQIAHSYPELRDEAAYGPSAVANLVDQGRVLPILDGLDALPRRYRDAVVNDGELMSQDQLILTCRGDYFDETSGFMVIRPRQVDEAEAYRFLCEVTRLTASSFFPLHDELDDPRLIYLTSIVCEETRRAVDEKSPMGKQLIEALMPVNGSWAKQFPWYSVNPEKWLRRLARCDLRDPDNRDHGLDLDEPDPGECQVAWWNLHRGIGWLRVHHAFFRAAVIGILAFTLITVIFKTHRPWQYSLFTAGAYGVLIVVAGALLGREDPAVVKEVSLDRYRHLTIVLWWLNSTLTHWWRVLSAGVLGCLLFGLMIGIRTGLSTGPHVGLRTGLWDGVTQGAFIVLITYFIAGVPAPPRSRLAADRGQVRDYDVSTLARAVLLGVPFGLLWGVTAVIKHQHPHVPVMGEAVLAGLITGVDFALGTWFFALVRTHFRSLRAPDPRSASGLDIMGTVLCSLILGSTFAFAFGVSAPFNFTGVDVVAWFVVGLAMGALGSEWPLYMTAIAWLSLVKRELPLRLMRFLECCRARGIVRVVGQGYQFHDNHLLKYLTAATDEGTAGDADAKPCS